MIKIDSKFFETCVRDYGNEVFKNTKSNRQIVFTFKSQLRFGRYSPPKSMVNRSRIKSSILADIWKLDPEYVKWLVLNADGFAIKPNILLRLLDEPVFNHHDLEKFIKVEELNDVYYFNLDSFSNNGDFKYHKEVRETIYDISSVEKEKLIRINLEKIEAKKLDCNAVQQGSANWSTNISFSLKSRKHILIKR